MDLYGKYTGGGEESKDGERRKTTPTVAERLHEEDVRYFARHPQRFWRIRRLDPRELPPGVAPRHATHLFVFHQPGTEVYGARPLTLLDPRDYPAGRIPQEHLEAADALLGPLSRNNGWVPNGLIDNGHDSGEAPDEDELMRAALDLLVLLTGGGNGGKGVGR